MTFSGFNPGDTRNLAVRMAEDEREQDEPKVTTRQFAIALAAILIALVLFGLLLTRL